MNISNVGQHFDIMWFFSTIIVVVDVVAVTVAVSVVVIFVNNIYVAASVVVDVSVFVSFSVSVAVAVAFGYCRCRNISVDNLITLIIINIISYVYGTTVNAVKCVILFISVFIRISGCCRDR